MKISAAAYFPFRLPFRREGLDVLVGESLAQLSRMEVKIVLSERNPIPVEVKRLAPRQAVRALATKHNFDSFQKVVFFRFSFEIDTDAYRLMEEPSESWKEHRLQIVHADAAEEMTYLVHQLAVACNIARPGSVNIGTGYMFYNGEFDRTLFGLSSDLNLLFAFGEKVEWPRLRMLRIADVWKWLSGCEDFRRGLGRTSLGRCLAAFSYLFVNEHGQDAPTDDLWLIVGLEAIFESNGSQRDLATRLRLFLGEPKMRPNWIYDLYKARSALIHGGGSLPFSFADSGVRDEVEQHREERRERKRRAIPALVAVLQKMCGLGLRAVAFETRLVTNGRTRRQSQRRELSRRVRPKALPNEKSESSSE